MKKRNAIFLVLLVVIVGAAAFLLSQQGSRRQLPPSFVGTPSPTPGSLPSFTYKDLQPGTTTEEQAVVSLGQPIRREKEGVTTTLVYPSGVGEWPLLVSVDRANIISLIKEPLPDDSLFSVFSSGLGNHDLTLYDSYYLLGYELRVYLSSGVAFLVNPEENMVRERWYFPPNTDATVFQRVFAPEYQTEPPPLDQE